MKILADHHSRGSSPTVPSLLLLLLFLLSLGAILFFGLTPKGFDPTNGATWISDGTALRFAESGMAYAEIPEVDLDSYSLDLAFVPATSPARGFNFLVQIHDGRDDAQLVIGQWQSSIIVLNGDDYSYRRREPRVAFGFAESDSYPIEMTLSSGPGGTRIYVDGLPAAERADTRLTIPEGGPRPARMIVGNSVDARHPWAGDLHSLTLRRGETSSEEAAAPSGEVVIQAIPPGPGEALTVPRRVSVLEPRILRTSFGEDFYSWRVLYDLVINVAGFVPFGALLTLLLRRAGRSSWFAGLLPVLVGAALSLTIETTQAWLPSRTSSLPDLLLNILGAAVGSTAALWWDRRRELVAATRRKDRVCCGDRG